MTFIGLLLRETWSLLTFIYTHGDHIYFGLSTVAEVSAIVSNSLGLI
jgi:hypothetical protein